MWEDQSPARMGRQVRIPGRVALTKATVLLYRMCGRLSIDKARMSAATLSKEIPRVGLT